MITSLDMIRVLGFLMIGLAMTNICSFARLHFCINICLKVQNDKRRRFSDSGVALFVAVSLPFPQT